MTPAELLKYSKREIVLESFTEGRIVAEEVEKDPSALKALEQEVNRKIRNLRRSKYVAKHGSEALATLQRRITVTGNHISPLYKKGKTGKPIKASKNAIASALMFVNAKTSTAAGQKQANDNRAIAFRNTVLRYLDELDVFTDDEKKLLRDTLNAMGNEELKNFADVYREPILGVKDYDSNQKMITIASNALDTIMALRNRTLYSMNQAITSKKAKRDFAKDMENAQIEGDFVLAQSSAEDVRAALKPVSEERRAYEEAQKVARKAKKSPDKVDMETLSSAENVISDYRSKKDIDPEDRFYITQHNDLTDTQKSSEAYDQEFKQAMRDAKLTVNRYFNPPKDKKKHVTTKQFQRAVEFLRREGANDWLTKASRKNGQNYLNNLNSKGSS